WTLVTSCSFHGPLADGMDRRHSCALDAGSAGALVRLEPGADRLLVQELGETLLPAALPVEELRLLDLRVEVVLRRLPAHRPGVLEAELGGAQHDRILLEQLARERLDLGPEPLAGDAPVHEPELRRLRAVEGAPGHDVEERCARPDRLREAAADEAPRRDA